MKNKDKNTLDRGHIWHNYCTDGNNYNGKDLCGGIVKYPLPSVKN